MENKNQLLETLIKAHFPIEYNIAGKSNVVDIIDGDVEFSQEEGGFDSSMIEIISVIGNVVTVLKVFYDLYREKSEAIQGREDRDLLLQEIEKLRQIQEKAYHFNETKMLECLKDLKNVLNKKTK
ncbi:MAG: hypothetical protein SH848_18065 [Saprospiraceae bacterium]|nr:hypothetical protein [Saprospiraceae bacterium]